MLHPRIYRNITLIKSYKTPNDKVFQKQLAESLQPRYHEKYANSNSERRKKSNAMRYPILR